MIALEGHTDAAPKILPVEANLAGDSADVAGLADVAVVDAGLLTTLR